MHATHAPRPPSRRSTSRELLLNPIVIHRSDHEYIMIETSVNSVRISIKVKQLDEMDAILVKKFSRMLMLRADNFVILRRQAMPVRPRAPPPLRRLPAACAPVWRAAAGLAPPAQPLRPRPLLCLTLPPTHPIHPTTHTRALARTRTPAPHPRPSPAQGYDVSFLLTNFNLEAMWKHKLIGFVVQFMEEIDSEISAMKIHVNERARAVGYMFLKEFT